MKNVKRIGAVLLVLLMVLSMTACGGGSNDNAQFVGTWTWNVDIGDMMDNAMAESLGMEVDVGEVNVPFTFTFNEDTSFTMAVDEAGMTASMEKLLENMKPIMVEAIYVQGEASDMSREEFDKALKESTGSTVEEMVDSLMVEINVEDLMGDMDMEEASTSGYYEAKDGKLYLFEEKGKVDASEYAVYTVEGNTITITELKGVDLTDIAGLEDMGVTAEEVLLPMVLTKK